MSAIDELRDLNAERYRLRDLAGAVYAAIGGECNLPERWLDVLLAASMGEEFTLDGLLPYKYDPPRDVKDARQHHGEKVLELVGRYWELAHREGVEGRETDTEDGAAAAAWAEIQEHVRALVWGKP